MRRISGHTIWIGCFLLLSASAGAQQKTAIAIEGDTVAVVKIIQQIESNTAFYFYYDKADLDTMMVAAKGSYASVTDLLDRIFKPSRFHYTIDTLNRIFITKRVSIQTQLAAGFFNPGNNTNLSQEYAVDDSSYKEKLAVPLENKLFEIGNKSAVLKGNAVISGYVRDAKSGEPITAASVYLDTPAIGVATDQFGYYSLNLPKGFHVVRISSAGMKDARRQIALYGDGRLNIDMQEYIASLKTVVVTAERASATKSLQIGVNKLSIKVLKQVPVIFGETDVLKVVQSLPGVTSVGESSNGINVRGGATDQNLILFNEATIYNPSHLFGLFSAFNPDVVKAVELYKAGIPEKYGGRLSSVLDISMQEGNKKKWTGIAGIGPLTGKITVEGPLKKDKTSLIAGIRTTYSNWLLGILPDDSYKNSRANFNEVSLNIAHNINTKNDIYLTGYYSNDKFNLRNDTSYKYGNRNLYLKWKHLFKSNFYNYTTAGIDQYNYSISSSDNPVNAFKFGFSIRQYVFRSEFNYTVNNKHSISAGVNAVYYKLSPGARDPNGSGSLVAHDALPDEQALETAVYLGDKYTINNKLSVTAGIRFSAYSYLGPQEVNSYKDNQPRDTATITGKTSYGNGKNIKSYASPEYRFTLRYALTDDLALKLSYNTFRQYIHMLSNTVSVSPTDIWKLSDTYIKPQEGTQYSAGLYKDFRSHTIETSVEVYYKTMNHYLDYKSGASLLLNHQIETAVVNTRGKAYGAELLLKKVSGKINGWISYTYSRTFLQLDDPIAGQQINKGQYYSASFDKPHNVNIIGNYRFSHRYSASLNVVYNTGRPITLPIAVFTVGNVNGLLYSERNEYRIPNYFRTDISVSVDGNHRVNQKTHNSWSFGVYNLTARKNAYSVYYTVEDGKIKGYQLSIFGTIIPFVTYNLKF